MSLRIRSYMDAHPACVAALTSLCVLSCFIGVDLILNGGTFFYSLDPGVYTHMALGNQIRNWHYGVQPQTLSSPSSEIIYPFLLALASNIIPLNWAPIIICVASTCVLSSVSVIFLREISNLGSKIKWQKVVVGTTSLLFSLNIIGASMSGMEHVLHAALVILCLLGVVRFIKMKTMPTWWLVCSALLPLVRYEGLADIVAETAVIVLYKRPIKAIILFFTSLTPTLLFSWWLRNQGLPALPSSVMMRSDIANTVFGGGDNILGRALVAVIQNAMNNTKSPGFLGLSIPSFGIILLYVFIIRKHSSESTKLVNITLCGVLIFVVFSQITFGSIWSISYRYEIYLLVPLYLVLLSGCGRLVPGSSRILECEFLTACILFPVSMLPYTLHSVDAIFEATQIHDIAGKERKLILQCIKRPVATSLQGLIFIDNPYPVLDLSGGTNEDVRANLNSIQSPSGLQKFLSSEGYNIVILHKGDELQAPEGWLSSGHLTSRYSALYSGASSATFYTSDKTVARMVSQCLQS